MWLDLQSLWLKLRHLPLRTHAVIHNFIQLLVVIPLFISSLLSDSNHMLDRCLASCGKSSMAVILL